MSIRILALSSALLAAAVPAGAQQFSDWLTPRAGYAVGIDSRESTDSRTATRGKSRTTTATAKG